MGNRYPDPQQSKAVLAKQRNLNQISFISSDESIGFAF
jgi:hypothetical protein